MRKHTSFFHFLKHIFKQWSPTPPKTEAELMEYFKRSYEDKVINQDTFTMLEGVIELAPMRVRDIVIPKTQMIMIEQDATLPEVIEMVSESGHSRFPVMGEGSDEIMGILHAKDLLRFQNQDPNDFELYDLLRPAFFVPESKRLLTLLSEFRKNRNHLAIVVDEYGAVNGVVTLEDIIEQIIGDIEDEFDIDDEAFVKSHGEHRYTLKGHTPIEDFNEMFDAELSDEAYDTIAGLVTSAFGHLPKRGETIQFDGFCFKILHADARRIQLIECIDKRLKGP